MFITMPIRNFKLDNNKVFINESVIEYEDISEDNREILESLISKGAYGSALLTLNMFYNVKSINESEYTQEEYSKYLEECNGMMEECVSETEAHDFRPLINLKGLEIMENADHIARGKGNKLLIEDFRNQKVLKEQDITIPSDNADGWGEDVEDLTSEFLDFVERVSYEIKNARRGSYAEIGTSIEQLAQVFERISDWAAELSETFNNAEVNYSDNDEDLEESVETKDRPTGNSHADEIIFDFSQSERDIDTFTKALNEISRMEYDNEIDRDKYDECIKKIQDLFINKDMMLEDCEGTQCSDIAEKKDQEVGSLQKPSKPKKHFTEMFKVPKNHGFKGFRLNEQGHYVRGKYILINEEGSIKAVRANMIDDYGTHVWDYNQVKTEQAPKLVADLNKYLNKGYDIYDFGFRIEDNQLKVYDANEEFDFSYLDDKYKLANKILQDLFGKGAYFEAELAPIGVVAGIEIRDLN